MNTIKDTTPFVDIDLRMECYRSAEISKRIEYIAHRIAKPFVYFIDCLSKKNGNNISWWVTPIASRNPQCSSLFYYCCCLELVNELLALKNVRYQIITDSKAFYSTIIRLFDKQSYDYRITFKPYSRIRIIKNLTRPIYSFANAALFWLITTAKAKASAKLKSPIPDKPITLLDTFVMRGYIDEDRYYGPILNNLGEKEKETIYFAPSINGYRIIDLPHAIRKMRRSIRRFILKQDYLKPHDILWALQQALPYKYLPKTEIYFMKRNIASLVREDLLSFRTYESAVEGLLNYCFAKRIKEHGIKLKLVINWFENQIIDKGWNAGFQKIYPEAVTKGYQGTVPTPLRLNLYPSFEEVRSKVVPEIIAIIGQGFKNSIQKFYPKLKCTIVPAFRFQYLWKEIDRPKLNGPIKVLSTLPLTCSEASHIIKLLKKVHRDLVAPCQFLLKIHPAMHSSEKYLTKNVKECKFETINGSLIECLMHADILLTGSSSTGLEAVAIGMPVIILNNQPGISLQPIPKKVDKRMYRVCYNEKDILEAIEYFYNLLPILCHEIREIGKKVRRDYFEQVSAEGVQRFLEPN